MKITFSKLIWAIAVVLLLIFAYAIYSALKDDLPENKRDHLGYPF